MTDAADDDTVTTEAEEEALPELQLLESVPKRLVMNLICIQHSGTDDIVFVDLLRSNSRRKSQ